MKSLLLLSFAFSPLAHATLPPSFQGAPIQVWNQSQSDFASQKIGPITFSVYPAVNNELQVAGAYDELHADDLVVAPIGENEVGNVANNMIRRGYVLRELSVSVGGHAADNNTFAGVFTKNHPATEANFNVNGTQFTQAYNEFVNQKGYRPMDHIDWLEGGQILHSVTFAQDGKPFGFFYGLDTAAFIAKVNELSAQGWELDSFHASADSPTHYVFSGIWLKRTHAGVSVSVNLSVPQYQKQFRDLNAQGYKFKKVVGYGKDGAFLAGLWVK